MPPHETLRIRTPPPDNETEDEFEQIKKNADVKSRNIPAIIFGVGTMNLLVYMHNSNETNLYMAITCGLMWVMCLLNAIYDKESLSKLRYITPQIESGV